MSELQPKVPAIRKPKVRRRGSRKLLILLLLFFVTVLAILFFQSSISKIARIEIVGNELVPSETIGQAAGIAPGDHFFGVSSGTIEKRIAALKMIESVQVSKRFPGLVRIEVKEYPRVAFQLTASGQKQVLLADGSAVDVESSGQLAPDKPILSGWSDDDPLKVKLCRTLAQIPDSLLSDISEIRPEPTESYPDKIKMYTRSRYEVYTTITYLPEKIKYLGLYVQNLQQNHIATGIITMLETDNHAPFPAEPDKAKQDNAGNSDKSDKPGSPDKPANPAKTDQQVQPG